MIELSTSFDSYQKKREKEEKNYCISCRKRIRYGSNPICEICFRKKNYKSLSWEQKEFKFRIHHVPEKYFHAHLLDFPQEIISVLKYEENKHGYFIWGDVGVGKTHLLSAFAINRISEGFTIFFDTLPDLSMRIRETYGVHKPEYLEEKIIQRTREVDYFFLDDLGVGETPEKPSSDFSKRILYQVLDGRINRNAPVVITSNFPRQTIASVFGKRIGSRLHYLEEIHLVGRDRRKKYANNE